MKMFDNHVHQLSDADDIELFRAHLKETGHEGAMLLSLPPGFTNEKGRKLEWKERLESVLAYYEAYPEIVPFFHVEPTDADISRQIDQAASRGIRGFKAIPISYDPSDPACLKVWEQIAETGRPLTFHTGILIGPAASEYCRPMHFEALLQVPRLKFSMAHASWPWIDEFIGILTKWNNCRLQGKTTAELYCDMTPGVKGYARLEAFRKLYSCEVDITERIMYGTDLRTNYPVDRGRELVEKDLAIFKEMGLPEDLQEKYFSLNMLKYTE